MTDLYDLATKNEKNLNDNLKRLKEHYATNSEIDEFQGIVRDKKKASINISIEKLYKVFKEKVYRNVFELGYSQIDIDKKYNTSSYSTKLSKFVNEVQDGNKIKYAALNTGGEGLKVFGELCVYLSPQFLDKTSQKKRIICLNDYSLNFFKLEDKEWILDMNKLTQSISKWENVDVLATLKHQPKWKEEEICGNYCTEILILTTVNIQEFESVKIGKHFKNAFDIFLGIGNKPVYKILKADIKLIEKLLSYITYNMKPLDFISLLNRIVPINHYRRFRKKAAYLENLSENKKDIHINFKVFLKELFSHIMENQSEKLFDKVNLIKKRPRDANIMTAFLLKNLYLASILHQSTNFGIEMEL